MDPEAASEEAIAQYGRNSEQGPPEKSGGSCPTCGGDEVLYRPLGYYIPCPTCQVDEYEDEPENEEVDDVTDQMKEQRKP